LSKVKNKVFEKPVIAESPLYNYILIVIFAILICFFTTYKIAGDDDVFWHLAIGKYIVQNHSIPSADVFGYLTQGRHWIPFEWGWEVLTYITFSIGGYVALSVLRTLIVLAIFAIIFSLLRKYKVNLSLSVFFSFILILGILTRLSIRPQIVSFMFTLLSIYVLLNHKSNIKGKKNIFITMPLIFLIWANMHMGVIFGMAVFVIYIFSDIIDCYFVNKNENKTEKKQKLKYLLISFSLSIVALLINPFFINVYLYTFSYTKIDMLEQINEWKSPLRAESLSYYNGKIYLFFLVSGLMIIYYSIKKKDYFPLILYIFVSIYSMQAMRLISDFLLTIFVFWMLTLDYFASKFKLEKYYNSIIFKIALTIFLIFVIINSYNNIFYKQYLGNYFRETGFGVNEKFFPKSMFDFIKKEEINKIGEKPFNNLKIGGYFIWNFPESKNFIDSRDLYDDIYTIYKNIDLKKAGFESLIDKYDIDYFIYSTPYLTVNAGEIEKNIISYLTIKNDKWKLVYWDDRSFLFVKNIPKFNDVIARCEYKYVSPYNFIFARNVLNNNYISDKITVKNEIERKLADEPNGILINDIAKYYKR
jgi:hypothetical protein